MRLILFHPAVAYRDCGHCQEFLYWEDGDEIGLPVTRGDKPVKRNIGSPPPCRTPQGCPKGTPEAPRTLSGKNEFAYQHDSECRAINQFPDDAIVKRNAATIRIVEDSRKRQDQFEFQNLLMSAISVR